VVGRLFGILVRQLARAVRLTAVNLGTKNRLGFKKNRVAQLLLPGGCKKNRWVQLLISVFSVFSGFVPTLQVYLISQSNCLNKFK